MKLKRKALTPTVITPIPFAPVSEQLTRPVEVVKDEPKEVLSTRELSFEKLFNKASDISDKCLDYYVKVKPVTEYDDAGLCVAGFDDMTAKFVCKDTEGFYYKPTVSPYALGQLATKLGIPIRYINNCLKAGFEELAVNNFNTWLENYDSTLFVRQYNGTVRGILSDRYSCLDTDDILTVLDDCINVNDYKIKGSFLNEERFHLRLVSKQLLPINEEDLFAGIFVNSSDVGRSVLSVTFGIYKQVCTNGLVIARNEGVLFEQKHIGITPDEFRKGLIAAIGKIDVLANNAVALVNECRAKKIEHQTQEEIDDFIKRIKATTNLSQEGALKVIDLMKNRYGQTKWGMINGITEVAQDYTLERRLELEKIAGSILVA